MSVKRVPAKAEDPLFIELSKLIEQTQQKLVLKANNTLTMLFWHIGNRINQNILQNKRADYGKNIVVTLSRQLTERQMLQFAEQLSNREL